MDNIVQAGYTATDIAKWFVWRGRKEGQPLLLPRLMALLYFSECAALHAGRSLFPEEFETWRNGAIIPALWRAWQDGNLPHGTNSGIIRPEDQGLLERVWAKYGDCSYMRMRQIVAESAPWKKASRNGTRFWDLPVSREDMGQYNPL